MLHGNVGLDPESTSIKSALVELNLREFYTCSSQPTKGGTHAHQRSYASGYMPRAMREHLIATLPTDIVVWQEGKNSRLLAAFGDGDEPVHYSWCGEMEDADFVAPYRPAVVAFHAMDMDWERPDLYLFDQLLIGIKHYLLGQSKTTAAQ